MTDVKELDRTTADGLANLLVVVGDNKHWMAKWLAQWSVGAPGLESAVAAAAIAQGHFGQARALFPFVQQFLFDHEIVGPEERTRRYRVSALDEPFGSWAQAVVTLLLVDTGLNVVLRSLHETQDELARRIGRVLDESRFYRDFAAGRLADLTTNWEHGRAQVEPHVTPILVEMLCWFGPPGEAGVEHLVANDVLTLDNDAMRQAFLDDVAPTLLELDYRLPVGGGPGEWTWEELPWDRWNALQRRLEVSNP
ncbi:Phenylacetic acid catabolic protein [Egicoccus sp. AB-alg2]|uniref:Phenylacetic acid catabolic protein n=1 Tax=Egicoccus sp. AB-alg2 TaxID=3242693 RepID=UPI00359D27E5